MSHSINILVSPSLHVPTVLMSYPRVASSSLLPWTFPLLLHLFMQGSMEPIPQDCRYACVSCRVAGHLPPAHCDWPKGPPLWAGQPPPVPRSSQRCGHRKHIRLWDLFVTAASQRPGCKQGLCFGSSHGQIKIICLIMVRRMHVNIVNRNQETVSVGLL